MINYALCHIKFHHFIAIAVNLCIFLSPNVVNFSVSATHYSKRLLYASDLLDSGGTGYSVSEKVTMTFPVFHDQNTEPIPIENVISRSLANRRTLESAPSSQLLNASVPSDLTSKLVTLDKKYGQYYAVFELGTPAIPVAVIIDTGSQILWIQCDAPCEACGVQAQGYPLFNPNQSSSFSYISCDACPGDGGSGMTMGCPIDNPNLCAYNVTYGDRSISTGFLSHDTLIVPGSSFQWSNLTFGCGVINTGVEAQMNASGLMGLDRGNLSLISQLGLNVFSYCLPTRVHTTQVSGYLTIGKTSASNSNMKYTPMLQNDASDYLSQFYFLNLTGISVNGNLLDIPSSAFTFSSSGGGGTIIDSGTTFSSFVDEAYTIIYDAFDTAMSMTKESTNNDILCYGVPLSQNEAPTAPKVTLHFANGVDIDLDGDHVLYYYGYDTTNKYYCMAFNNAGTISSGAQNFIGNYQQQNLLVEYDIGNSRVGFAPTICNHASVMTNTPYQMQLLWIIVFLVFVL